MTLSDVFVTELPRAVIARETLKHQANHDQRADIYTFIRYEIHTARQAERQTDGKETNDCYEF